MSAPAATAPPHPRVLFTQTTITTTINTHTKHVNNRNHQPTRYTDLISTLPGLWRAVWLGTGGRWL